MSFYPFGGTVSSDTAAMLIGGFMPMSPTAAPVAAPVAAPAP